MTHPTDCPCEDCEAIWAAQAEWQPVALPQSVLQTIDEAFAKVHSDTPGNPHWYTIIWFTLRRARGPLNYKPLDFLREWINAVDASEQGQPFGAGEDAGAELIKTRAELEKSEKRYADLRHRLNVACQSTASDSRQDTALKIRMRRLLD